MGQNGLFPWKTTNSAIFTNKLSTHRFGIASGGSSNSGCVRKLESNNCSLCGDPLDPKAIAKAIQYLLNHPEEARRMGENGRRAVEEKYNWEKEGEKLLSLYAELLTR